MKSLMLFFQSVLSEEGTRCCTSTVRDYKTISDRVENEGLSFLTITLANFGADFQKSLDQGFVGNDHFDGFSRNGGLPRLFGGFLSRIFDLRSGRLLDDPDIDSIRAVRQFTLMWAKINLPCTKTREAKAISGYIECEKEIKQHDRNLTPDLAYDFVRAATVLWSEPLSRVDGNVFSNRLVPNHGPGFTADRQLGNQKWNSSEWTTRLDSIFSFVDYILPSSKFYSERAAHIDLLEPGSERPVKVVTVPKTQKSPRIIAMEPTCMQYMQQALKDDITEAVDADDIASKLIGWSSQIPNQEMARLGSLNGDLATLDMSEASDRVSNQHVRLLLTNHPWLARAVDACRSRKADVPGFGVQRLSKFASMGSALTFPIESMVFMTIIFMAISKELNRPLSKKLVLQFLGRVRVYGDDIIIPVEFVPSVTALLETFGLKVNAGKSFWTGKFRESCGKDFYRGEDVSIVRVRDFLPTCRKDVSEIISTVSLRNQLYKAGLWQSARYLDNKLERLIPYPTITESSPALGRHSFLGYQTDRNCPNLHRPLVRGMVVRAPLPLNQLDGIGALLKCLVMAEKRDSKEVEYPDQIQYHTKPSMVIGHLERSGRPRAVSIMPRFVTPY